MAVETIVRQACQFAATAATEKNIALELVENVDSSVRIAGDVDSPLSGVGNLLSNAIRYTPEEGRVTVHARGDARRGHVTIEVCDSGIGMRTEVRELPLASAGGKPLLHVCANCVSIQFTHVPDCCYRRIQITGSNE